MIDRLVTVGEGLAVFRGAPGEALRRTPDIAVSTGGAEANVAMAAARLGLPSLWIGRVGDDGLGERVVRELRSEGVEVLSIVDADRPTGLLVKEISGEGRTRVSYYRSASAGSALTPDDLNAISLTSADLVHVTGITPALSPSARAAVDRMLELARDAGATISFDVNHRSRLWRADDAAAVYRSIAERADLVFASVDEVGLLLSGWVGRDAATAADALAAAGHAHVVVTDGANGSAARVDGVTTLGHAHPVRVVDTVGAGDAFVAGYLASFALGADVAERLALASRLGAAACTNAGDWEGVAEWRAAPGGAEPVMR